jgi:PAS domain S-box-containing protein
VVVVAIDERSLTQFGRWPWQRDTLGRLVKGAADGGAAVVAMDVILSEADLGANDEKLAQAMASVPTVVGYSMLFDGGGPMQAGCESPPLPLVVAGPEGGGGEAFFRATGMECTVPKIAKAAAGGGFLNAVPDRDGRLRMMPLIIEHAGRYYPSLALAAMSVYGRMSRMQLRENARGAEWLRMDDHVAPLEGRSALRVRYRGPGRTFPYVSAADVLAGRVGADALRGKIVVIGASASGLESTVATPTDPQYPALEVQATAIDTLLQRDFLHRPGDGYLWELSLALLLGAVSVMALVLIRSLWGGLITLAMVGAVWIACEQAAAHGGVLLSPLPSTAVLCCNFIVLTMLNYRAERKRAEASEHELASAEERAEEERQESESRYRRLVENVNDAIITNDLEGRLLFANRRFREWFGLADGEIGVVALEDCVAPEWRDAVREQYRRLVAGVAETGQFEYEGIRPDRSRICIEALVTTMKEGARITGTQSALRDVTERKRLEVQYLQSQKMESVGRLAGGVAHDFNNLLTVINGYSDLLLMQMAQHDPLRGHLLAVRKAGERASSLTHQLLAFSRRQILQPQVLDLNDVVAESESMLLRLIEENIQFITVLAPSLCMVSADPTQLSQILLNLAVNARDAMPHGGVLRVETANATLGDRDPEESSGEIRTGNYVMLEISDSGVGMDEHTRRHLFEPFFTTKGPGKGTGLGLATVYGIVKQSGGVIRVESAPGMGTTVRVYLPCVDGATARPPAELDRKPRKCSGTVLLVEDQENVRRYVALVLESLGYRVLEADCGFQALNVAASCEGVIDLLLTDVVMPGMTGPALAQQLQQRVPGVKVLYMSGYTDDVAGRHGVLEPGAAYLQKPFGTDTLSLKVREVLER